MKMSLFRKRRVPVIHPKQPPDVGKLPEGEDTKKSKEELEKLELQKKEQEAVHARQQEARARELESLNSKVDNVMSKNSEEFMAQVRQPGGE
jgi:hypothetical protein